MTASTPPSEPFFFQQSLTALPLAIAHCRCPDHWHTVWAGLKANGSMRGLHGQVAVLADLLRPRVPRGARVLIAGAADTGSLDVLHEVLQDPGAQYTVVDLCPAPLHMVRRRADEAGLQVRTLEQGLDDLRADQPWDLVFIHYTLSFMDAAYRARFLARLQADVAPGGVVLCAVRDKQPDTVPADPAARAADWLHATRESLASTFGAHPDLLGPLLQGLPAYAQSRQRREDSMVRYDQVVSEFATAGFDALQSLRNPGQNMIRSSDLSPPGSITSWIGLFARPRG